MSAANDRYQRAIARGAFVNLLGNIARLSWPLFLLLVTRLWGSAFAGLYLLAHAMVEVAATAVIEASADATVVFASRHVDGAGSDDAARRRLYRVLGTTLRVALGLALVIALAALVAGRAVIERFFPEYRQLVPGVFFLAATLVPRALSQTAIAATKARLHMHHDAFLNGLAFPVILVAGGSLVYALGGGFTALLAVHLAAECLLLLLAGWVFARHFSLRELAAAMGAPIDRSVLRFMLPQGLNLTFNRYIARLDGIMLAAFALGKSDLGFFSTAALFTSMLSQIRGMWTTAMAPVAARLHEAGERGMLEDTIGRVARWSMSLLVPATLIFVVFRVELLGLVSPDYARDDVFVLILLMPPFTSCAYGIAAACMMFTGHTGVTLVNSVVLAVLNTGLTYALIPRYGMTGAAIATAIATSVLTAVQMIELAWLEGVRIRWRAVARPHLGLLLGVLPVVAVWDPAHLPIAGKLAVVASACAIHIAALFAFRPATVATSAA